MRSQIHDRILKAALAKVVQRLKEAAFVIEGCVIDLNIPCELRDSFYKGKNAGAMSVCLVEGPRRFQYQNGSACSGDFSHSLTFISNVIMKSPKWPCDTGQLTA